MGSRFFSVQPGVVLDAVVTRNRIALEIAIGATVPAHYAAVVVRICAIVDFSDEDVPPVVHVDVQRLYKSLARNDWAACRYALPPGGE